MRLRLAFAALVTTGCFVDAEGLGPPVGGDATSTGGAATGAGGDNPQGGTGGTDPIGGMPEGGAPGAQHCPPGQIATAVTEGVLACASPTSLAVKAIASSCAVHYGWRDNCDAGCTQPPDRWGKVDIDSCVEPANGDSTCQVHDLGSDTGVQLFGWDLDGGADTGDRFYGAIQCVEGATGEVPCEDGTGFLTGYDGRQAVCSRISGAVLDYVRPSCALVRGWRDQCDGCTDAPTKYVVSTSVTCDPGVGGYCAEVALGPDTVELASFDADALVNEDDKLHFGLRCEDATSGESEAEGSCPAGEFVVGLTASGALVCTDLGEAAMTAFRAQCSLFAGWRDSCDGCTDAPTKWGRVRDGDCINNGATNDTCSTMEIDGQTVSLYGLNLDGGVNNNDKFYIGFRCQ